MGGNPILHHSKPQQFEEDFARRGVEIHRPENLRPTNQTTHSAVHSAKYNKAYENYLKGEEVSPSGMSSFEQDWLKKRGF